MSSINTKDQFDIKTINKINYMNGIVDVEKSNMGANRNLSVSGNNWEIDILNNIFNPDTDNMINNFSCGELEANQINVNTVVGLEEKIFNSVYPTGRYIFVENEKALPIYSYYDINDQTYKTKKWDELWKKIDTNGYIYATKETSGNEADQSNTDPYFTISHSHNYQTCDFKHAKKAKLAIGDYLYEVRGVTAKEFKMIYSIPNIKLLTYVRK